MILKSNPRAKFINVSDFLNMNNLTKLSDGVYHLNEDYSVLKEDLIEFLKKDLNNQKRSRINFHRSSDSLVQKIIAMHNTTEIDVHAHDNKS